jgi:hypothetical protein
MADRIRKEGPQREAATEAGAEGSAASARNEEVADEQEQIRARAYERWQARGGEGGDEREDWYEAEREYRQRSQGRSGGEGRQREPRRDQ